MADIRAMTKPELEAMVAELGQPAYRAKQIYRWLHLRGVRSFDEMTDLPAELRQDLSRAQSIDSIEVEKKELARDGTRKYALRTAHKDIVEAVFIPDASSPGRNTLCISSQVGCAIDCKFCLTASLGLLRNLTSGEIAEQVTRVKEDLAKDSAEAIQNIVMMGMGEPLQNYANVLESLRILTGADGHRYSPRRITVSTAGLAPRIPRLGQDIAVNLAVSLNATTDEVRDRIMPINKRWNIRAVLDACLEFPLPERRRITFEYVLLEGINDTSADAHRLVDLLSPIRSKVNLIPFNEHPYSAFKRPSDAAVRRFQKIVGEGGIGAFIRTPRGDDISAACGQLGVEVDSPKKRLHIIA